MDASADIDKPASSRRTRKKERTRRDIYEAAMGLFNEKDYDDVTIGDICERADVAKATFFLHFPNKAALLSEFNEKLTSGIREQLEGFKRSATDKFCFVISELAGEWQRNAPVMRKMTREFVDALPTLEAGKAANESLLTLTMELIREAQKAGEFRKIAPPHRLAAAFVAASSALTIEWTEMPGVDTSETHKELLDVLLNGLRQKPK